MFFSSCRWNADAWWADDATEKNSHIFRYDRLVDEFVSLNSFSALQQMNTEYPVPTRLLIENVLGIGSVEDAHIEQRLRDYFLDSTMQLLLQDVVYFPLGHPDPSGRKVTVAASAKSRIQTILESLMLNAEGED